MDGVLANPLLVVVVVVVVVVVMMTTTAIAMMLHMTRTSRLLNPLQAG